MNTEKTDSRASRFVLCASLSSLSRVSADAGFLCDKAAVWYGGIRVTSLADTRAECRAVIPKVGGTAPWGRWDYRGGR